MHGIIFLTVLFNFFVDVAFSTEQVVFDKNLVTVQVKYQSILKHHAKYDTENARVKYFEGGPTLAYVTPWNNHGYDIVKMFKGKFDYVSPVWYNIHRRARNDFYLSGGHDVDQRWIEEVRVEIDGEKRGKIVPRFATKDWSRDDYLAFIRNPDETDAIVKLLVEECRVQNFDGLVFETGIPTHVQDLMQKLGEALHKQSKELILVLAPTRPNMPSMTAAQFEDYSLYVDRFAVMTYDYSIEAPGPSAPIYWVEDNILTLAPASQNRDKILLGLNMYGWDFEPSENRVHPILGHTLLKKLEKHKPRIEWDRNYEEHYFEYIEEGTKHVVWHPTLKSIESRLLLAEDYGVGLSLWEVGQGLDYYYDLF